MSETSLISFIPVEQPSSTAKKPTRKYTRTADKLTISPADALKRYEAEKTEILILADERLFELLDNKEIELETAFAYLSICAHAYRTNIGNIRKMAPAGECYPSVKRLSILSGRRREYLLYDIKELSGKKWFTISEKRVRSGRYANVYYVNTSRYEKQKRPFTVSRQMFLGGAWSFLKPSERLAWFLCRSSAWYSGELAGHDARNKDYIEAPTGERLDASEVWFIPAHHVDLSQWAELCGISRRTMRDAFISLADKGFIWSVHGENMPGFALRVHPAIPADYPGWADHLAEFYTRLDSLKAEAIPHATQTLINFIPAKVQSENHKQVQSGNHKGAKTFAKLELVK